MKSKAAPRLDGTLYPEMVAVIFHHRGGFFQERAGYSCLDNGGAGLSIDASWVCADCQGR